jgi:hypothetical protein
MFKNPNKMPTKIPKDMMRTVFPKLIPSKIQMKHKSNTILIDKLIGINEY